MMEYKQGIRNRFPKIYSQDLLNNLFRRPYTKIDFVCTEFDVTRPTATSYLNQLVNAGFLTKMKNPNTSFHRHPVFSLLPVLACNTLPRPQVPQKNDKKSKSQRVIFLLFDFFDFTYIPQTVITRPTGRFLLKLQLFCCRRKTNVTVATLPTHRTRHSART